MEKKLPRTKKTYEDGTLEAKLPISNAVLAIRKAKGMAQGELADRVGLTRQAMYDIEANHYLPSTAIALRLADALDCQVEDLFSLSKKGEVIEAELLGVHVQAGRPFRVNLAQVGDRIIARPLAELGDVLNFVVSADGIVTAPVPKKRGKTHQRVLVELLHDRKQIEKHIVIAGCDPSLFIAGGHVRQLHGLAGITNWTMGSANALHALLEGEVHIAGVHLVDARSGESNIPYLKRHVQGKDYVGVRFASWVQGIVVGAGNPLQIRTIEDFGRPNLQLVNREVGAGARFFLDALLKKTGIHGRQVKGYDRVVTSHLEVARLIRDGLADMGIGVEAVARHYGLDFIPLQEERYDLILRKDVLGAHPMIAQLFDAMVSRPFRQELETLGGYNLTDIGTSLNW
ncbi:MAG: substrate-binding domain-containing protein [Nitrospirales bacterium]